MEFGTYLEIILMHKIGKDIFLDFAKEYLKINKNANKLRKRLENYDSLKIS